MRFFALLWVSSFVWAQLSSDQIDDLAERTRSTFQVPGLAIAVVQDGKIVHMKGYGLRSVDKPESVDEHTLFGIASLSKAFTNLALAILVEQGKLDWSDRVIDHDPAFRLYDPYVTQEFQIVDLVTHRSGLPLGAGDLMQFPESDFSRDEILANLRFLKPSSSFRSHFDYDNSLYLEAGLVLEKVSGMSWQEAIQTSIFQPLGMTESYPILPADFQGNMAQPHALVDGKPTPIKPYRFTVGAPAGAIHSNLHDMTQYMLAQLAGTQYGADLAQRLVSADQDRFLKTAQTLLAVSESAAQERNRHFSAYALGWFLNDDYGVFNLSHTGGLPGMVCKLTLLPDLKVGVLVLTNQESGYAFNAITDQIVRAYAGQPEVDQVAENKARQDKREAGADEILDEVEKKWKANAKLPALDWVQGLEGTYQDDWYGKVSIEKRDKELWLIFARTPALQGPIRYLHGNTFRVKWQDRSLNADAYLTFQLNPEGKIEGFDMKAISPLTDFSYDFHHLHLEKQEAVE